jgi:hypothetical protein
MRAERWRTASSLVVKASKRSPDVSGVWVRFPAQAFLLDNALADVALSAETLDYSNQVIGFKRLVEDIGCAGND